MDKGDLELDAWLAERLLGWTYHVKEGKGFGVVQWYDADGNPADHTDLAWWPTRSAHQALLCAHKAKLFLSHYLKQNERCEWEIWADCSGDTPIAVNLSVEMVVCQAVKRFIEATNA